MVRKLTLFSAFFLCLLGLMLLPFFNADKLATNSLFTSPAYAQTSRILIEGADSTLSYGLQQSEQLEQQASSVSPRILVEYADSVLSINLEPPVPLVQPSTPTPTPTPTPAPTPTPMPTPSPKPGEVSVYLYGQITKVPIGQDIVLNLSAVNLITKPTMTVQLILKVPSGMSVTSTGFVKGGGGQYTASYSVEPGDIKQIEVHIMTNQEGNFNVVGDICYYFGGDKSTAEYQTISLPVTVRESIVTPEKQTTTPSPKNGGGLSCSAPAQGASPPSSGELLLGWGPIGLCWGSLGGCYCILRWRRRNHRNNHYRQSNVTEVGHEGSQ